MRPMQACLLLGLLMLSLPGCGNKLPAIPFLVPEVKVEVIPVPEALQTCQDAPDKLPREPWPTSGQVAKWAEDVYVAWGDCRGTVAAVKVLMQPKP